MLITIFRGKSQFQGLFTTALPPVTLPALWTSGRWFMAARPCRPHYGFHASLLSSGPEKRSSKLQLTGRFPSQRVSDEKHLDSKAKIFYGSFFPPRFSWFPIAKPEINIYSCLVWLDSDDSGLQKWREIIIFKCISYWVILPLGDRGSVAWMPLQIPLSPLSRTQCKFQLNQVNKLNQETILFRKTLV